MYQSFKYKKVIKGFKKAMSLSPEGFGFTILPDSFVKRKLLSKFVGKVILYGGNAIL